MHFDGPGVVRETFRWSHVCTTVRITSEGAHREVVADGDIHYNFTTDYFESAEWPLGHNFSFGGREIYYYGEHVNGYLTDIQIFSRVLTYPEMVAFTSCSKVTMNVLQLKQKSVHISVICHCFI